jgi:hypothetical protein
LIFLKEYDIIITENEKGVLHMAKIVILCIGGIAMKNYTNYMEEEQCSIFNPDDTIQFYFLLAFYLVLCLVFFFL